MEPVQILVETHPVDPLVAQSRGLAPSDLATKGLVEFEKVIDGLKQLAEEAGDKLLTVPGPSKVGLEFDLDIGAEGGLFIVGKVSADATIKVTLEWDRGTT